SSENDNQVAWYNNQDGVGDFTDEIIITSNAIEAKYVHVADVNNDNTNDVIITSYVDQTGFIPSTDNKIAWFSNTDGNGTFGSEQMISTNAIGVGFVITGDIDGDNNPDIIS